MDMNQILAIVLVLVAIAGVAAVALPYLTGDIRGERRQEAFISNARGVAVGVNPRQKEQSQRRKKIAESLKELEAVNAGKKKKLNLDARIRQAGLTISKTQFFIASAALGTGCAFLVFIMSGNPVYALAAFGVGGFGLSNWGLNFMRTRRINQFIAEFPGAVDVIIRGVKAGLPLGDCIRIIAAEAAEPVRSEFRRIVEAQGIGLGMGEAVSRLYENVPTAEANFFSIVINIQQNAGGNLSEALGNLSRVLRERKKMKQKIKAMSSEAKASAYIIGALPFVVSGMVYLTSPRYMEILWMHPTGRVVIAISGFWMLIGILSMRKMVNFDF